MSKKTNISSVPVKQVDCNEKNNLPGYQPYPVEEDIYSKYKEEKEINPEEISNLKETIEIKNAIKGKAEDLDDIQAENDLDVPGSELDDEMEDIGSEDEENNYYSIGGDDHSGLEESMEQK